MKFTVLFAFILSICFLNAQPSDVETLKMKKDTLICELYMAHSFADNVIMNIVEYSDNYSEPKYTNQSSEILTFSSTGDEDPSEIHLLYTTIGYAVVNRVGPEISDIVNVVKYLDVRYQEISTNEIYDAVFIGSISYFRR